MLKRRGAAKYGDSLTDGQRRLGRHLPRIASGDDTEEWEEDRQAEGRKMQLKEALPPPPITPPVSPPRQLRHIEEHTPRNLRVNTQFVTPPPALASASLAQDPSFAGMSHADEVAGIPGRLRLSRVTSAPVTPLPSARLGNWADVQRHLLQAYEYLCHVGEAQQWIEGCLGEELGFGVVEMEERLRNGVVLARLAQVWDRASVRRIFDVCTITYKLTL